MACCLCLPWTKHFSSDWKQKNTGKCGNGRQVLLVIFQHLLFKKHLSCWFQPQEGVTVVSILAHAYSYEWCECYIVPWATMYVYAVPWKTRLSTSKDALNALARGKDRWIWVSHLARFEAYREMYIMIVQHMLLLSMLLCLSTCSYLQHFSLFLSSHLVARHAKWQHSPRLANCYKYPAALNILSTWHYFVHQLSCSFLEGIFW